MEKRRIRIARPLIGDEEKRLVVEALSSGQLAQGQRVADFENAFAGDVGCKHAIAVSNGTAALHVANLACSGKRPKALTTPFTFIATANTLLFAHKKPVFADVLGDGNIDPARVKASLKHDIDIVLPVHLYGNPCDIEQIVELAAGFGAKVVEDAAQAHGARIGRKHVGTFGDAGIFSFYPTKNMTTSEGGMITTSNDGIADELRLLRNHGQSSRYEYAGIGFNVRMTDISASIGLAQLKHLEEWNSIRRRNAKALIDGLSGIKLIEPPVLTDGHVFHQFTVRVHDGARDALAKHLNENGVDTAVHYPKVLYAYPHLTEYATRCPTAERLAGEVLSLPVHPSVTEEDVAYICESVRGFKS